MPAALGPVLTNVQSVRHLREYLKAGRFNAVKVIDGWGIDSGWTNESRRAVFEAVPAELIVVRGVTGDHSYHDGRYWLPDPDQAEQEAQRWVAIKPDVLYEIGNEPDTAGYDEATIWKYRAGLDATITRLRTRFPRIRLVAPSPRIGRPEICTFPWGKQPGWERWARVLADVARRCDYISLHLYGWTQIIGDGKGEYAAAKKLYDELYGNEPVLVTELGINHPPMPKREKMRLYREFAAKMPAHWKAAYFYHLNAKNDIHPEYAIPFSAV